MKGIIGLLLKVICRNSGYPFFLLEPAKQMYHCVSTDLGIIVCLKEFPYSKLISFSQKVLVENAYESPASLTCRARPLVSIGRVNAEMAHTTQTDEKRQGSQK